MGNKDLLQNPNKFAASIFCFPFFFGYLIWGYQKYLYLNTREKPIALHRFLLRKSGIVESFYQKEDIYQNIQSILDIGSNNGFFLLQARYFGVKTLTGVDIDKDVEYLYSKKVMKGINFINKSYEQVDQKFDVTLALSLTHWMVGQIAESKQQDEEKVIENMFQKIQNITNYAAVIELVTSDDALIVKHNHHSLSITVEDYLHVAKKYFSKIKYLGSTRTSRHIYAFYL